MEAALARLKARFRTFFSDAVFGHSTWPMEQTSQASDDLYLDRTLMERKVLAERTRVFADRAFASTLAAPLGMLLLAWVGSATVGLTTALLWFVALGLVEFLFARYSYRYRRTQPANTDIAAQAQHLVYMSFAAGLGWGASVWIFWREGAFAHYLVNLTILVGVAGVSVMLMSPFRSAALLFLGSLLLLPMLHAILYSTQFSFEIAIGFGGLLALLLHYSRMAGKQLIHDLESTVRNRSLAERLQLALDATHQDWFELDLQTSNMVCSTRHARRLNQASNSTQMAETLDDWLNRIHPQDREAVREAVQALRHSDQPLQCEYRISGSPDQYLWIQSVGRVVEWGPSQRALRLIGIHTDITARKIADQQITQLAFYDYLTALPNRRLLQQHLQESIDHARNTTCSGALMLMDMDDFKALNDTMGHDVGDRFLIEVANRIQSCVGDLGMVARFGGDEFVVVVKSLKNREQARAVTQRLAEELLDVVTQPYLLELHPIRANPRIHSHHCTASIGIALFDRTLQSTDDLMKHADTAMYEAKAKGRNTFEFFDPDMQIAITARTTLDRDLRDAVHANQFVLYYQPQVDGAGHMTGAEALIRWQHPTRGLVPPIEFISMAEASGLIHPIGQWVLKTACKQLEEWSTQPHMAHLTLSVNVSAMQFHSPEFMDDLIALLQDMPSIRNRLKLEITESLFVNHAEAIISQMTTLQAQGIRFSMDDFGTGYSSLSYLKRLPLDQLKIDKSFIQDVLTNSNDAAIARAIVAMAQSLGLTVIAEGVEAESQRQFLAANDCHAYQGYLFGKPTPIAEFEQLLAITAAPSP